MRRHAMRARLRAGLLAGAMTALAGALPAPILAQTAPADFTGIVRQQLPAVVGITTRQMVEDQAQSLQDLAPFGEFGERFRRFFEERQRPGPSQGPGQGRGPGQQRSRASLGSGFIISPDGYVVTNSHVVENASDIRVVFNDSSTVPARVVGRDPATDLAVLKVDGRTNLPHVRWGNSEAVEPGAWVVAIGSPFGLGGTVTVGVLSARSRDIRAGPFDDFLQTDASINRGNSGGPLFNTQGEVIGVNTAIFSPSGGNIGIGFAVPSRTAQNVVDQIIRTGRVERGFVGLRLQAVTDEIAKAMGLPNANGVLVAAVEGGSPAERAGIRAGDVIVSYSGQPVESPRDLSRAVAGTRPGTQASLGVIRNGNQQFFTVSIGQRPDAQTGQADPGPADGGPRLGLSLAPLDETARRQAGLEPGTGGVLVQRVEPNSPAAENGFQPGDVIVSANNREVSQPSDVAEEWSKARQQNRPILLRVRREGEYRFVTVG